VGAVFGGVLSTTNSHGPAVGERSMPSLADAEKE
jgi:hypothetical protein